MMWIGIAKWLWKINEAGGLKSLGFQLHNHAHMYTYIQLYH